jgi:hypothetical protein
VVGVVGSNVKYAPPVEYGTKPHFVPPGELEAWARRHNTDPFVVSKAIARRGTKAHRYLQRAFEDNQPRIQRLFGNTVSKIARQ